jgi:hypothetical protein
MKRLSIIILFCLVASYASGATYYVDYVDGADTNNGTETNIPWKHCPGDDNATDTALNTTLQAGDTVIFKGGVTYRGRIDLDDTGSSGSPISYKGNEGWGTGKAILSGAEVFDETWTQCPNAAACWDNANYANIYYTTLPSGMTVFERLLQDGEFLWISQDPNPTDRLWWNQIYTDWYSIDHSQMTDTTITDSNVFTQSSSSYWDDAYVSPWMSPNVTPIETIDSFNTSTDTITFSTDSTAYTSGTVYYSLLNHPALIDEAGEYAVSNTDDRLYLWTSDSSDPNTADLEKAARGSMFTGTADYIVIDGFIMYGTYGNNGPAGPQGNAIISTTSSVKITVTNNTFQWISGQTNSGIIRAEAQTSIVNNNILVNCQQNRGIYLNSADSGTTSEAKNNDISRIGYTGIMVSGSDDVVVASNTIYDKWGVHGTNGISVYTNSANVVIEYNDISDCSRLITFQSSSNLTIRNNLLNGSDRGLVSSYGSNTGYIYLMNNTMVNKKTDSSACGIALRGTDNFTTKLAYNNVSDGISGFDQDERKNNIRTFLASNQNEGYGWYLGENEQYISDVDLLFTNHAGDDFTPIEGILIDGGRDTSAYGVTDDFLGVSRPLGPAWDIGAYESLSATISGVRILP